MKEIIKKVARYLSGKPLIGKPIKIVTGIVRIPQIRDKITEINQKIDAIKFVDEMQDVHFDHMRQKYDDADAVRRQSIEEIQQRLNEIVQLSKVEKTKLNEANNHIEAIKHHLHTEILAQVNSLNEKIELCEQRVSEVEHYQDAFDAEYLPRFNEALEYSYNLKRSLPVVLREHRRSIARDSNK